MPCTCEAQGTAGDLGQIYTPNVGLLSTPSQFQLRRSPCPGSCGGRSVWFGRGPDLRLRVLTGEVGRVVSFSQLSLPAPGSQCPETVVICRFRLWLGWSNNSCRLRALCNSRPTFCRGCYQANIFSAFLVLFWQKQTAKQRVVFYFFLVSALPVVTATGAEAHGQRP